MGKRYFAIIFLLMFFVLSSALFGCSEDDDSTDNSSSSSDDDDDDNNDDDTGNDTITPESIVNDYADMAAVVAKSMDDYFHENTWHGHFGDGLMYGPSYDLAEDFLHTSAANQARAVIALDGNLAMVEDAASSLGGLINAFSDVESLAMAMLGLMESGQYIDVPEYVQSAERLANLVDILSRLVGDYLPPSLGEFAGATYGPTAISSLLALLRLGLVISGPEEEAADNMARAQEILENIHNIAWSDELGAYRFAPDDDRIMLYPNATMMLAYGRACYLSKNQTYVNRVELIYQGIQPLKADAGDHYFSPYSREEAGAVDEDYATLSSQNYLMTGLWFAYQNSDQQKYLDDIHKILGWIETHLYADHVLKHHWVNGRTANEQDTYDFCSGCNLQTLYILRIIESSY